MKISINKSAKRVLSTALALIMLVGTLFTANVGTVIEADATTPIKEGTIDLLEFGSYLTEMGSTSIYYDTKLADNGETGADWDNAIIIDSAEEFVYLSKQGGGGNATAGKYYKVADGIAGFDLSAGNLNLDGTLAENLEKIQAGGKNHSGDTNNPFQGNFDGNGVTVYGAVIPGGSYSGLFSNVKNTVLIKNLNVRLCSFKGSSVAGGIVGYHKADVIAYEKDAPLHTLTIENCTVADTYLEITGNGWGTGVGAILGRGDAAPSWKEADKQVDGNGDGDMSDTIYVNTPYIIKNCFVNLDEDYFKSSRDDKTEVSGERACHGGVAGMSGSNALTVSDCVVIGITPYATTDSTAFNDIQHTGLAAHYKNVYTDQATGSIVIGGQTGWAGRTQDFSSVVFQLTDDQLKGAEAVGNMNLAWFSAWLPGEDGEYPVVNQTSVESDTYFWDGTADTKYAGGTGTKEDPYIIKTPAQLYGALSTVTGTTSGVHANESKEVAGGVQSGTMLRQGSTTDYVPVYTPYYYKIADGVKNFYFNNVYGNETLAGIKALVASGKAKAWTPGKSFVGHLDCNGVNIYGMYSSNGTGFVYKLDGPATIKNINFSACYSKGTGVTAILTTNLGSYANDTTLHYVDNISVRESRTETTAKVTQYTDGAGNQHTRAAGGIIATGSTPENLTMSNCFYDGYTCEIVAGDGSLGVGQMGGIISGGSGMNNVMLNNCVALGAPVVDIVYIEGTEFGYNRYDATQGFQVFFYDCYTDVQQQMTAAYPGKYDKLLSIKTVNVANTYNKFDFPTLGWGSNWALVKVGERTFPMPLVNTAEESVGSYIQLIGQGTNKYAGVGPYEYGSNPYTYKLKGAGTEEDPYIIENAEQFARAIATGGMNLYDRLYYRLDTDLDLSGGAWINQTKRAEGGIYYTYTPFGGQLDGNGHTITGLSAGDNESAGLIPVLASTGVVKNLHVRKSSAISSKYAGIIAGETQTGSKIIGCSVEDCEVQGKLGTNVIAGDKNVTLDTVYYTNADAEYYLANGTEYNASNYMDIFKVEANKGVWYIGGKEGSRPKLTNANGVANELDVDGDGVNGYSSNDLTALRHKLLRKSAYANINGDVSRNGAINIADLAVLQRSIVGEYGAKITDSFFANVQSGQIEIYYGENDNYDAARKVELYLESLFPGLDVEKHVSSSKGTVTGANSDASKVYLHEGDTAENPDGKLDIIIGDVVGYSAESGMAANTYEVTYDSANKVVWLKGQNFTAVEQAAINFVNGSSVDGDVVYTCGSTVLDDYKKPITVKLDTNFDGTPDKDTVVYYAWGDEFEDDTIDTHNWQHNTQQTEGQNGSDGSYNNLEMAPVKDLNKVIVVENGKLSLKRGHDKSLGGDVSYDGILGSVALDVTPGEFNGYRIWSDAAGGYVNAIDTDGSDKYFTSGKVTTERGMLFKQGYIEFEGRLPADGHAFPAWWLMGRSAQTQSNSGYDNSLYGKVYKYNKDEDGNWRWDGSTDAYVANQLNTYKYQIPSAIYEIDMIEVMQHADRHLLKKEKNWLSSGSYHDSTYKTLTTATNLYYLNSTVHKWWNNAAQRTADGNLYIQDWDNYTVSSAITNANFKTTSTDGSWIHNIGSTQYDFGTATADKKTLGVYQYTYWNTAKFQQTPHDNLTANRRYGFSWNTNGTGFEATLYIYNTDGTLMTTVPIASGMSDYAAFKDKDKNAENSGAIGQANSGAYKNTYSDAKVFNQYMYILFDNKYYTSNDNSVTNGSAKQFTDLLTSLGLKSLEVNYVRVYQQDGERDIVTQATENFNNANHFGY